MSRRVLYFSGLLLLLVALSNLSSVSALEQAPDFSLTSIDGELVRLSALRGKIVLLDFFYIDCPPCKAEISELKQVDDAYGDEVVIISIDVNPQDSVDALKDFREQMGMTWTIVRDTENVAGKYGIFAVPTLLIIDKEGYIRSRHIGYTEASTLINEINNLLTPVAFDFGLYVSPERREVRQGSSVGYTITVSLISGTAEEVQLSVSGLPEGATYHFDPSSGTPPFPSVLTITVGPNTPPGTYKITIVGTGGGTTRTASITLVVMERQKGCVIATAAYGSPLAPEVQFLRDFRDSIVYSTYAGSCFMQAFNAIYYSFSPQVAGLVAKSELLRALTCALLYPLIQILKLSVAVYQGLSFAPELGVALTGVFASALIGAVYLTPPTMLMEKALRRLGFKAKLALHAVYLLLPISLCLLAAGETLKICWLTATASIATTTLTAIAVSTLTAKIINKHIIKSLHL